MTTPFDPPTPTPGGTPSGDADAHIDAIARAAGRELRRPAPPDGPARALRTRRRQQAVRATLGGTATVALVVLGVVALRDRGDDRRVVTVDSVGSTELPTTVVPVPTSTAPGPTTVPGPTPTSAPAPAPTDPGSAPAPTTVAPTTTADAPPAAAAPTVYATADDPTSGAGVESLVDPRTGATVGSQAIDPERARAAQQALPGGVRSNVDLGEVAYAFDQVFYDAGTLDTERYTDVDLCGQNVVTVRAPGASAVPARAHVLSVSPDDRYVVTLSSVCPEAGTMGADGIGTDLPFTATFQVFDAARPDLPGRTLADGVDARNVGGATFSGNGRFVALETYGEQQYRVFDLETGDEVDVAGACSATGLDYSRFVGPWIGQSSIALLLDCADGQQLLVRDLMPGGDELRVPVPSTATGAYVSGEVDVVHAGAPADTWFILCDGSQRICWVGHGSDPLVELTDVADASFLPLGYVPGG